MELYRASLFHGDVPDALIMDLTIPGEMGGLDAAAKILGLDPSARLIVSSGYSNDPILASYSKHGFREALLKPFSLEELRVAIRTVLR